MTLPSAPIAIHESSVCGVLPPWASIFSGAMPELVGELGDAERDDESAGSFEELPA